MRPAIVFLLASLTGCALFENVTPAEHLSRLRTVHQAVRTVAIKLHDLGYVTEEQWATLKEIDVRATAALDEAEAQVAAGADFDFGSMMGILESAQSIIAVAKAAAAADAHPDGPEPGG